MPMSTRPIDSYTTGQVVAMYYEEGILTRLGIHDTGLLLRLAQENQTVRLLVQKAEQERTSHPPSESLALLPSSPQLPDALDPDAFEEGFWQEVTFLILRRWHGLVSASTHTLDETRQYYALQKHPDTQNG